CEPLPWRAPLERGSRRIVLQRHDNAERRARMRRERLGKEDRPRCIAEFVVNAGRESAIRLGEPWHERSRVERTQPGARGRRERVDLPNTVDRQRSVLEAELVNRTRTPGGVQELRRWIHLERPR